MANFADNKRAYREAKPKPFGNLHERMQFAVEKRELLVDLISSDPGRVAVATDPAEVSRAIEALAEAVLDLQTEAALYPTDRRSRAA